MPDLAGNIISHYKVLEKLGEGGNGIVYKAEDLKLKRPVALKFLSNSFSYDEDAKKRFIHEAQSASALDHSNIYTIHEIGNTDDGKLYISIAYYDGETLKDRIKKGALNKEEVIDIGLQICSGLSKAHQSGIVHRDIKPANIFITKEGIIKILDFGLAKSKDRTQLTKEGTTVGTVAYMSPEQARGEEVDLRTDIWSLGVVLYELLTGKLMFNADYDQAIIYSILNEKPDLSNLPKEFIPIIKKAAAKDKESRYQTVEELIYDIKLVRDGLSVKQKFSLKLPSIKNINLKVKLITGTFFTILIAGILYLSFNNYYANKKHTEKRKMIVVLPFENLGMPEDEYFAQGMREEISNKLAALGSIGVISRSSAEKYAGTKKTAREIGKELGVDYILEGTMQWASGAKKNRRVRIIPQLIKTSDDTDIWSDSYDKVLTDIFNIQNEIAQNVVAKLGVKLLPNQFVTGPPPTTNLEAYDYYLKANQMKYRVSAKEDVYASIRLYEKAIALDSNFAAAYAQIAISYMGVYDRHYDRSKIILDKIQIYLQKAEKLNPNLADVHLALAFYYSLIKSDYETAFKEFNETLEIQPNNAEADMSLSLYYWDKGKFDLDLKYSLKALELDPLSSRYAESIGVGYYWQRDYKNAEKYFKRAIELTPYYEGYYARLIYTYLNWKGNTKEAWIIFKQLLNKKPEGADNIRMLLNIYDRNYDEAIKILKASKNELRADGFVYMPNSLMIALIYRYKKDFNQEIKYFNETRIRLEKMLLSNPNDFRLHIALGNCYAGLNKKEKALSEIIKGIELIPGGQQTFPKYIKRTNLAAVYTLTGDYYNSLKQIDSLLSVPGGFSVNELKLDPLYAPMHNLPGYKAIIEKFSNRVE